MRGRADPAPRRWAVEIRTPLKRRRHHRGNSHGHERRVLLAQVHHLNHEPCRFDKERRPSRFPDPKKPTASAAVEAGARPCLSGRDAQPWRSSLFRRTGLTMDAVNGVVSPVVTGHKVIKSGQPKVASSTSESSSRVVQELPPWKDLDPHPGQRRAHQPAHAANNPYTLVWDEPFKEQSCKRQLNPAHHTRAACTTT